MADDYRKAPIAPFPDDIPGEIARLEDVVTGLEAEIAGLNSAEEELTTSLLTRAEIPTKTAADRLRHWNATEVGKAQARLVEHTWEDDCNRQQVERRLADEADRLKREVLERLIQAKWRREALMLVRDYPQYIYHGWDKHTAWYHADCYEGRRKKLQRLGGHGSRLVPTLLTRLHHADNPAVTAALAAFNRGETLFVEDVFVYRADHADLLTENARRECVNWTTADYHILLEGGMVIPMDAEFLPTSLARERDAEFLRWVKAVAEKKSLQEPYVTKVKTHEGLLLKVDQRVQAITDGTMPPIDQVRFVKEEGWDLTG